MSNTPAIVYLLVIVAIWVLCGLLVGGAAARKNRSRQSFFWLTILLSPILTGLIVASLPFTDSDPRHPANKDRAKPQAVGAEAQPYFEK